MAIKKSVKVPLIDAPVGLFYHGKTLCMKTEYFTNGGVDAYIVSSGEYFHGGTTEAIDRNNLMVRPVDPESLHPVGRWKKGGKEKLYCDWEMNGWYDFPLICTNCKYDATEYGTGTTNYCPNCGARMKGENDA